MYAHTHLAQGLVNGVLYPITENIHTHTHTHIYM